MEKDCYTKLSINYNKLIGIKKRLFFQLGVNVYYCGTRLYQTYYNIDLIGEGEVLKYYII